RSALSWKHRTVATGPKNSVRPPRSRNWVSQLRTSSPISSTRSAVGTNPVGLSVMRVLREEAGQYLERYPASRPRGGPPVGDNGGTAPCRQTSRLTGRNIRGPVRTPHPRPPGGGRRPYPAGRGDSGRWRDLLGAYRFGGAGHRARG